MPYELPAMNVKPLLIFAGFCLVASCGKYETPSAQSDLRCGLSDLNTVVPSLLEKSRQCPSCLSNQVREAIKTCPDDRGLLLLGMYSSYRANDLAQAAEYYEELAANNNASTEQHTDAGYIFDRLGRKSEALEAFKLAVSSGADAFVQYEFAKSLHQAGRDQEAIPILKRIIEANPKAPAKNGVTVIGEDAVSDEAESLLEQIALKK